MGVSVYHSRTATGADNAAYDVQLQRDWNASHLFTLNAVGSEVSGAFANGGGVSFGLSADGVITAAAPAGAPSPVNISAGGAFHQPSQDSLLGYERGFFCTWALV